MLTQCQNEVSFTIKNRTELLRSELSSIHKFETFKSLKRKYVCNTDGAI